MVYFVLVCSSLVLPPSSSQLSKMPTDADAEDIELESEPLKSVVLETSMGDVQLELYWKHAPRVSSTVGPT